MSFDTHRRTMMGITPADFTEFWATGGATPDALGANCGVGPAEALDTILEIAASAPGANLAVKGNCGVPFIDQGQVCYRAAPATMADYACLARDAGARIIGGCCGTGPDHIAAMAAALVDREPGGPCDRARIAAVLGAPWTTPGEARPRRDEGAERRRRRR
ncbi:MAG: homocysteine S-methyltransferase family protein, partial [Thalassobaculaceae bacterium]